ncbi:MAG: hypothetical protein HY645_14625 [Acidobacteria bacterium]|nr:hypothetical protein [Acidobacteriota bacterium]
MKRLLIVSVLISILALTVVAQKQSSTRQGPAAVSQATFSGSSAQSAHGEVGHPRALVGDGLTFIVDPGIRVDNAVLPKPYRDPKTGTFYLYYQDESTKPSRELVASSSDGLVFGAGITPPNRANDPTRLLLPNGVWRRYLYDPQSSQLKSASSNDGLQFTNDLGVRYQPQAIDKGSMGGLRPLC